MCPHTKTPFAESPYGWLTPSPCKRETPVTLVEDGRAPRRRGSHDDSLIQLRRPACLSHRPRRPQVRVGLHGLLGVSLAQRSVGSPVVGGKIAASTLHTRGEGVMHTRVIDEPGESGMGLRAYHQ
jgi:hypothetical protein